MRKNLHLINRFAVLSFAFLFITVAKAQLKFQSGPIIGIQGSQISGDTYGGYNMPGVYAGLFTNIRNTDQISFQIEVAYSQKGARKIPDPRNGDLTSYDLRLNYIEIPVFLRPQFKDFSFDIGLSYGQLLGYYENDQFGPRLPVRPFRKFELGGLIGAGYNWGEHLLFSVRVIRSLIPVREHQSTIAFWWNPGQMNNALCFSLAYRLGMSREAERPENSDY